MTAHINHILVFLVVALGLLAKLYFWKRYNLAEFVAVAFYIAAGYVAFGTLTMMIGHYLLASLRYVSLLGLVLYVFLVFPAFLQDRRFTVRLRSLLLAVTSLMFYMVLGFGFSFLIVWLRASG